MPASLFWDRVMFTIVLHLPSSNLHFLTVWETEDTMCGSFSRTNLCSLLPSTTFQLFTVCGFHCLILLFVTLRTFSPGDRCGLQAGQSSTHTLSMKPNCCKVMQNDVWHFPDQINTRLLGKNGTVMEAYVSPKLQCMPLHQWYLSCHRD